VTTLVLLPGMDGTGSLFAPLLRELPGHWATRVIRYPADPGQCYDELLHNAWTALPEGPVTVLGESFAGPLAIRLAASLGPRLQALILCCTFARNPRPSLARFSRWIGCLPAPSRLPAAWAAWVLLGRRAPEESRALLAEALAALPAAVLQARLRMVLQVDVRAELAGLRVPVLYLQARQDLIVPADAARDVQKAQPVTIVRALQGPHGLLQSSPRAAAEAITAFLSSQR